MTLAIIVLQYMQLIIIIVLIVMHACSRQYRTVIFNGDVDSCVPFIGNEVSPVL